jgi:hypothetical protein
LAQRYTVLGIVGADVGPDRGFQFQYLLIFVEYPDPGQSYVQMVKESLCTSLQHLCLGIALRKSRIYFGEQRSLANSLRERLCRMLVGGNLPLQTGGMA